MEERPRGRYTEHSRNAPGKAGSLKFTVSIRARDMRVAANVSGHRLRRRVILGWCAMGLLVGAGIATLGQWSQLWVIAGAFAPVISGFLALRRTRPKAGVDGTAQPVEVVLDEHGVHLGLTSAPWSAVGHPVVHGGTLVVPAGSNAFGWFSSDKQQPLLAAIAERAGTQGTLQDAPTGRDEIVIPAMPTWPALPQAMMLLLPMGVTVAALRWLALPYVSGGLALLIVPTLALCTAWWWMPRLRGGAKAWAGADGWIVQSGAMRSSGSWTDAPLGRVGRAVELGVVVIPMRRVGPDRLAKLHAWSASAQAPWDDLGDLG